MNNTEFDICFHRNMQGIEFEKAGNIEEAMVLYELNVSAKFVGSHPYDRLAKYYHARKDYKDEIRVIETYFSTFPPEQLEAELQSSGKIIQFNKRLQKAKELSSKSQQG